MKIQFRDYLGSKHLLEHMVLTSIGNAIHTIQPLDSVYQTTGELDIEIKINGIEVNTKEFFDILDNHVNEHEKKFEKWKAQYISKNSDASKKEKLVKEFQKANQMLQNINEKLH